MPPSTRAARREDSSYRSNKACAAAAVLCVLSLYLRWDAVLWQLGSSNSRPAAAVVAGVIPTAVALPAGSEQQRRQRRKDSRENGCLSVREDHRALVLLAQ
jgi:hypothetical protein